VSARTDVLLWANRVITRKGKPPHILLEIAENATAEQVQEAFHKIARTSHPDLHRHGLTAEELELVTSAYATVAGAYQQLRSMVVHTVRMKPLKPEEVGMRPPAPATSTPSSGARSVHRAGTDADGPISAPAPAAVKATGSRPPAAAMQSSGNDAPVLAPTPSPAGPLASSANAAQAMSSKALLYYRKAELCLKRGDLKGAILQLKLACAADPMSGFLRTALAEVETEVRSKP
jgi:hypothetical protein